IDGRRGRGGRVVDRVGGREGDRQHLTVAYRQDRAGGRRVGEGPGHAGGGVELGRAQGRPLDDVRRGGPGERRRRLRHVDGRRGRGGRVVGRVGGREGDREGLTLAGGQDRAGGRRVGEGPGHAGGGVELGRAQGRPVDDVRRVGPGERRRRLHHVDRRLG